MEFTDFIIKIRSLKNGTQVFEYNLDGSFFAEFGNSIILDASLRVLAEVEKSSGRMEVNFLVNGIVVTECDRCLERLEIPMDFRTTLSVKFARTGEIGEQIVDDSSEDMVIIDPSEGELDLKQYIYDYVCINLPLQRVHSEGECNAEVMRILNGISSGAERRESREDSCEEVKENLRENEKKNEEADAPQLQGEVSEESLEALVKRFSTRKGK